MKGPSAVNAAGFGILLLLVMLFQAMFCWQLCHLGQECEKAPVDTVPSFAFAFQTFLLLFCCSYFQHKTKDTPSVPIMTLSISDNATTFQTYLFKKASKPRTHKNSPSFGQARISRFCYSSIVSMAWDAFQNAKINLQMTQTAINCLTAAIRSSFL